MASLSTGLTLLLAAAAAFNPVAARPSTDDPRDAVVAITNSDLLSTLNAPSKPSKRGSPQAPNGYTPTEVNCPSDRPTIRNGTRISDMEREWLPKRRNETISPIRTLLKRLSIPDFDSDEYLKDVETNATALPNIGIAISGGGYRAMLCGAGALAAWDIRSDGSDKDGNLGGLLQSATYLSGLSGGGWLVGSLMMNNFTSVQESVNYPGVWQLEYSILEGPKQYSLLGYYDNIFDEVSDKKDAGYERSLTDYWGRMLSYQLINATDGGPSYTWSSLADDTAFSEGKAPMPILIADGRAPNEKIINLNSTVFEFTPWELGSYDPTLDGFVPLKYVGSEFDNGEIPKGKSCVRGFDNAGFVMGTSSSLFNAIVQYLDEPDSPYVPDGVPDVAIDAVTGILDSIGDDNNDIADWTPNPFKGWNEEENLSVDSERLTLVDGGEDLQNVPYYPHIRIEREVDVVFSFDSSADTDSGWPDGASPIATYERSLEDISRGSAFPVVPGKNTFLNLGLNTRPTFFGCNATNTSDPAPLIVYIPNYPYVYASNISTFQPTINASQLSAIIENGYAVATMLNATRDENWPVCVGCAMLSRSFDRTNTTVPEKCRECFQNYCWNGTLDESDPGEYNPTFIGQEIEIESFGSRVMSSSALAAAVAVVAGFALTI
ncbi:lysophospholipase [Fusarium albosuccineum]|uniref:Lysophospholipase n=1 Tax=Fusarium albosuccineum TaxID=1237068 RepID=A0A8H4LNC8_9HYPO|nr:lysophospholipase [Fusarium albosuccineum]